MSEPEYRNRYSAPPTVCTKCGNRVIRDTGYNEFSCCICGSVYYVREGAPPVRRLSTRELHVNAGIETGGRWQTPAAVKTA